MWQHFIHYSAFCCLRYVKFLLWVERRSVTWLDVVSWCPVDFVTPLKKRRLARESLSVDGSLRSISEEEDSPSAHTASPPDAMPPSDTISSVDNFTLEVSLAVSTNECRHQVTLLITTTAATTSSSSNNLLRSRCMTSSSYQSLPLFPVLSCPFECHILSFHHVTQQVHSFPTSSSLPHDSSLDYIMQ